MIKNSEFTGGSWMNDGPIIQSENREHLIVSTDLDETNDYTSVALVRNERDIGIIIHAPAMFKVIEELVMLNTFKERFGETDTYRRRMETVLFQAENIVCDFVDCAEKETEDNELAEITGNT